MSSVQLPLEDHIANSRHQLTQNLVEGGMDISNRQKTKCIENSFPPQHTHFKLEPCYTYISTTVFPTVYHEHMLMLTCTHCYQMIFESSIRFC